MTETSHPDEPDGRDEETQDMADSAQPETGTDNQEATDDAAAHKAQVDSDAIAKKAGRTQGLLVGLGIGAVAVIVVLVLAVFVWPGYPGSPDSKASEVTAAWGSKKPADLEAVSCNGPAGKMAQYPPQMMNMVQQVKQSGPVQRQLDTEATMPIDLTVSAQGKTQTLPANVILGVTDGDWCMKGLQPRK